MSIVTELLKFKKWEEEDIAEVSIECGVNLVKLDPNVKRMLGKLWFRSHERALKNAKAIMKGQEV